MTKESIAKILFEELTYLYCDSCRFQDISEEEANELYGHYGCEDCYRKHMEWEISEGTANILASKILESKGE